MAQTINYVEVIGFKVFSDNLSVIPISNGKCRVINTISPNSYGISTTDEGFDRALKNSEFLVLDGLYFALASLLLQGKNIKANQGMDVFYHFMNRLNAQNGKAFFLGSTDETLEKIKIRAEREFPNIDVRFHSPPFKPEFSIEDNIVIREKINEFKPDVVFIGMTCPKQEKWAVENRDQLEAGLTIAIGNVFDWYAGTQKLIRPIWFKLRLGWLVRIFLRPEIFSRNIGNQMKFFWHLMLIFLRLKKLEKPRQLQGNGLNSKRV